MAVSEDAFPRAHPIGGPSGKSESPTPSVPAKPWGMRPSATTAGASTTGPGPLPQDGQTHSSRTALTAV